MRPPPYLLPTTLALLMTSAIIELSFVSSTVFWLHRTAGGSFQIVSPSDTSTLSFPLHGKPAHLLVNQGHTSNAAAGTAFILVGLGGIAILLNLSRRQAKPNTNTNANNPILRALHATWLLTTLLSALLTLTALIYTFALTRSHAHQTLDLSVAAGLENKPYPNQVPYPLSAWTPENWFAALLGQEDVQFVRREERDDVAAHLRVMRGWRWNLVPLFVLGVGVCGVAGWEAWAERRRGEREMLPRGGGKRVEGV